MSTYVHPNGISANLWVSKSGRHRIAYYMCIHFRKKNYTINSSKTLLLCGIERAAEAPHNINKFTYFLVLYKPLLTWIEKMFFSASRTGVAEQIQEG